MSYIAGVDPNYMIHDELCAVLPVQFSVLIQNVIKLKYAWKSIGFYIMRSKNMKEKGAESSLDKGALLKIQTRGFCAPKQILLKGGDSPVKIQGLEKA